MILNLTSVAKWTALDSSHGSPALFNPAGDGAFRPVDTTAPLILVWMEASGPDQLLLSVLNSTSRYVVTSS